MQSVPYLAAFIFSMSCISMSAHADTPITRLIGNAISDQRRPADQVKLDATRKPAQLINDVVGANGHVYACRAESNVLRNPGDNHKLPVFGSDRLPIPQAAMTTECVWHETCFDQWAMQYLHDSNGLQVGAPAARAARARRCLGRAANCCRSAALYS